MALIRALQQSATSVRLLIRDYPNIIQYTDACGLGAGGVVVPGTDDTKHYVWQFKWPEDIKSRLITWKNPNGDLTINNLELAALVLGWLVIEYTNADLQFKHIGSFCDNTPTVAWATKGHTSKSIAAGRLLRLLLLRQRQRQCSALIPHHLAGEDNKMADIPLRAFKNSE